MKQFGMLGGAAAALMFASLVNPASPRAQAAPAAAPAQSPVYTLPKRRRIVVMRHGDVAYFTADGKPVPNSDLVVLTQKGRDQADAAGKYLTAAGFIKFDRVISSNLPRTVETAERALAAAGIAAPVVQEPALREIKPASAWRAVPLAEVPPIFLAMTKPFVAPETPFIGGETVGDMQKRVYGAIDALMADQSWDSALLVLHAVVNGAIISRAVTGGTSYLGRLESGAGCLHILDAGAASGDWVLRAYNVCPVAADYQASRSLVLETLLSQAMRARQGN